MNDSDKKLDGSGKRFNQGKTRHDLVPAYAQEEYAKVLTIGASKYGVRNWERGMAWSNILASLERHLIAIKRGEDRDKETGLLHSAHIMCNAAFLTEYYKIYPQGDDRNHWYKLRPRIGLDVDEVLADFIPHYNNKFDIETTPTNWNFDSKIKDRLETLKDDYEFWSTVPARMSPTEIPFEPHCYITSRVCPSEWTSEWIEKKGFPTMPVYSTNGKSKVEVAKESGIDWFIDDRYENFVALTDAGICCFLWDAPHNEKYDVGFKRIKSFQDLPLFV
jgi:5'(3')-deoxyribonucleotidase